MHNSSISFRFGRIYKRVPSTFRLAIRKRTSQFFTNVSRTCRKQKVSPCSRYVLRAKRRPTSIDGTRNKNENGTGTSDLRWYVWACRNYEDTRWEQFEKDMDSDVQREVDRMMLQRNVQVDSCFVSVNNLPCACTPSS